MTGTYCCVLGCTNNRAAKPELIYFTLPKDKRRLNVWLEHIKRNDLYEHNERSFVCSEHFAPEMYKFKRLLPTAVPTLLLPGTLDGPAPPKPLRAYTNKNKTKPTNLKVVLEDIFKRVPQLKEFETGQEVMTAIMEHGEREEQEERRDNRTDLLSRLQTFPRPVLTEDLVQNSAEHEQAQDEIAVEMPIVDNLSSESESAPAIETPLVEIPSAVEKPLDKQVAQVPAATAKRKWSPVPGSSQENEKRPKVSENAGSPISVYESSSSSTFTLFSSDTDRKAPIEQTQKKRESTEKKIINDEVDLADDSDHPDDDDDDSAENLLKMLLEHQKNLKSKFKGNRYSHEYKYFALNVYFACPKAYSFLANLLKLPSRRILSRTGVTLGTRLRSGLVQTIARSMLHTGGAGGRYCALCVDDMPLHRQLYYDAVRDSIVGLRDVDGARTTELAGGAVMLSLRGLVRPSHRALAYSLYGSQPDAVESLSAWIESVLRELLAAGLLVVALVARPTPLLSALARRYGVTIVRPYLRIGPEKVYFSFDVRHLTRAIRDEMLAADFVLEDGRVARFNDIEAAVAEDEKREIRLVPRLAAVDLRPEPGSPRAAGAVLAARTLSSAVAAAIAVDVRLETAPARAADTARFVFELTRICGILRARRLVGTPEEEGALADALVAFSSMRFLDPATGIIRRDRESAFRDFQITIGAITSLLEYFRAAGQKCLRTRRLGIAPLERMRLKMRRRELTADGVADPALTVQQFRRAFSKLALESMFHDMDAGSLLLPPTGKTLSCWSWTELTRAAPLEEDAPVATPLVPPPDCVSDTPRESPLRYVAGYLFARVVESHSCRDLSRQIACIDVGLHADRVTGLYESMRRLPKCEGIAQPPASFVHYVRALEKRFAKEFPATAASGGCVELLGSLAEVRPKGLCRCFPVPVVLRLFLQLRIYYALRSFNKELSGFNPTTPVYFEIIPLSD